jgi:hypothetical protein
MIRPRGSALAIVAAVAIVVVVAVVGCGGATHVQPPPTTLPPHAVPYLPSSAKALSAASLAREAGSPSLSRELSDWGFLAGADRYFQGESRRLQVVDSRTFRFKTAAGAASFVAFVRLHAAAYLGSSLGMHGFSSRGRNGILATAAPCRCHRASPAYLGVVSRGGMVTWLEINGPAATPRTLAELIAAAP